MHPHDSTLKYRQYRVALSKIILNFGESEILATKVRPRLLAYIDESGQRGLQGKSSPHFILSAAIFFESRSEETDAVLERIRVATNRLPGHHLHFNKFKPHHKKVAVEILSEAETLVGHCAVVTCKDYLERDTTFNQDAAYMNAFGYLLERLSWIARNAGADISYTLAHTKKFKLETLRKYEAAIKELPANQCQVDWRFVVPGGGSLDQPQRLPYLQLADFSASAIGLAFNGNGNGVVDRSYLEVLASKLYRGAQGNNLTSYGLKMHPWRENTKAAYPWVAAL
ncbi:DUF3800 domain-containing protein [Paeniglutamicibacter sp.]|uniref:DUF3800 domain-containing protein n=1 Tax=Paeniglutamicibacter sp. TaxID=1934391 RepID=UPI0039892E2E